MGIKLRQNEEVKIEADLHWSTYVAPIFIMSSMTLFNIVSLISSSKSYSFIPMIIGSIPFAYRWLDNKSKTFIVTNERVYIESGILAKMKKDVSLKKINEVNVVQSFIQRILGSGSILIMTGNDKPVIIADLDNSDDFKDTISKLTHS